MNVLFSSTGYESGVEMSVVCNLLGGPTLVTAVNRCIRVYSVEPFFLFKTLNLYGRVTRLVFHKDALCVFVDNDKLVVLRYEGSIDDLHVEEIECLPAQGAKRFEFTASISDSVYKEHNFHSLLRVSPRAHTKSEECELPEEWVNVRYLSYNPQYKSYVCLYEPVPTNEGRLDILEKSNVISVADSDLKLRSTLINVTYNATCAFMVNKTGIIVIFSDKISYTNLPSGPEPKNYHPAIQETINAVELNAETKMAPIEIETSIIKQHENKIFIAESCGRVRCVQLSEDENSIRIYESGVGPRFPSTIDLLGDYLFIGSTVGDSVLYKVILTEEKNETDQSTFIIGLGVLSKEYECKLVPFKTIPSIGTVLNSLRMKERTVLCTKSSRLVVLNDNIRFEHRSSEKFSKDATGRLVQTKRGLEVQTEHKTYLYDEKSNSLKETERFVDEIQEYVKENRLVVGGRKHELKQIAEAGVWDDKLLVLESNQLAVYDVKTKEALLSLEDVHSFKHYEDRMIVQTETATCLYDKHLELIFRGDINGKVYRNEVDRYKSEEESSVCGKRKTQGHIETKRGKTEKNSLSPKRDIHYSKHAEREWIILKDKKTECIHFYRIAATMSHVELVYTVQGGSVLLFKEDSWIVARQGSYLVVSYDAFYGYCASRTSICRKGTVSSDRLCSVNGTLYALEDDALEVYASGDASVWLGHHAMVYDSAGNRLNAAANSVAEQESASTKTQCPKSEVTQITHLAFSFNVLVAACTVPEEFVYKTEEETPIEFKRVYRRPRTTKSILRFYNTKLNFLNQVDLMENERVASMRFVKMNVAETKIIKEYLAVGTCLVRGEDRQTRGRVCLFEVRSDGKASLVCDDELRGCVSALHEIDSLLLCAVGLKVFAYEYDVSFGLNPVAFADVGTYTTSIDVIRNVFVCSDYLRGPSFFCYMDNPRKLMHVSSSYACCKARTAKFMYYKDSLAILTVDEQRRTRIHSYEPKNPHSQEGDLLIEDGAFNLGYEVVNLLSCAQSNSSVLCGVTQYGVVFYVIPVSAEETESLRTLTTLLETNTRNDLLLNHALFFDSAKRVACDLNYANKYFCLNEKQKKEVLAQCPTVTAVLKRYSDYSV